MTTTRSDTARLEHAPISWELMLAATLLAGVTIALVWYVAVPWGPIVCPAIYPAPRNCIASERAGTALVVTIVLLAVYLATMAMALIIRRGRRLAIAGVILLAIAPVISYASVAWTPGFLLSEEPATAAPRKALPSYWFSLVENGRMYELFGGAALVAAIVLGTAAAVGRWVRPRAVPEYWAALVAWCFQLFVSMAAVFWVTFLGISTPHCSPNCEWDLLGYNLQGFMIATALIQIGSIVLIVLLRHRPKVWVVPVASVALVIALCVASSVIAYKAMLFF